MANKFTNCWLQEDSSKINKSLTILAIKNASICEPKREGSNPPDYATDSNRCKNPNSAIALCGARSLKKKGARTQSAKGPVRQGYVPPRSVHTQVDSRLGDSATLRYGSSWDTVCTALMARCLKYSFVSGSTQNK